MILILEIAIGVALGLALWNYRGVIMPVVFKLALWALGGALLVGVYVLGVWAYRSFSADTLKSVGFVFGVVALGRLVAYLSKDENKMPKENPPVKYGPGPQ